MENDLVASENTINVVAAVLNVNPEELKDRGQTPPKKKNSLKKHIVLLI